MFSTLTNHQKKLKKDLVCLTSVEGLRTSVEWLRISVAGLGTSEERPLFRRKNLDSENSRGYHDEVFMVSFCQGLRDSPAEPWLGSLVVSQLV